MRNSGSGGGDIAILATKQAEANSSLASIDTKTSAQSTATKQDTGNTSLNSIDAKLTSQATAANQTTANAKLDSLLTELQLKADLTETQPVSLASVPTHAVTQSGTWTVQPGNTANTTAWKVDGSAATQPISAASLPLPSGAATSALQTQPGVDIGDVTINNSSGVSAVNIQDGGNSITVDNANLDVTLSTRLKSADTLAGVTTVTTVGTITNVVHIDDNSGSLTIDNSNLDASLSTLAKSSEMTTQTAAINTLLKPANTLAAVTTVGAITNVVHVDDNSGSLTIDNANLDVALSTRLKPADTLAAVTTVGAVTSITNALPTGSNVIGKISVDQTTPGTTNKVSIGTDGTVTVNPLTNASIVKVQNQDNSGTGITSTLVAAKQGLDVYVTNGGGGTSSADLAAFTEGTTSYVPIGGVYSESQALTVSEDLAATARITAKRAIHMNLRDSNGIEVTTIQRDEVLNLILLELRAMKQAIVSMATEGRRANPIDFSPEFNDYNSYTDNLQ